MCRRLIVIIMFQIIKSWIFSKAFHDGLHGGRTLLIQGRGKDDFIAKPPPAPSEPNILSRRVGRTIEHGTSGCLCARSAAQDKHLEKWNQLDSSLIQHMLPERMEYCYKSQQH